MSPCLFRWSGRPSVAVVGFRSNGRIKVWTGGLKQWAMHQSELTENGSPEQDYAIGVLMAVMDATHPGRTARRGRYRRGFR
jgi:hypothetical protein